MQLIIISGKIGSGKSTLSKYFQKKGYYYINSDSLAKDIILNNKFIIDKLKQEFDILNDKKIISLKYLKNIFLLSEKNKDKINAIVHPFFYKELNLILGKSSNSKIVLELPLIETSNNIKYNFKIVTIKTNLKTRKQRYLAKPSSKAKDFIILNKVVPLKTHCSGQRDTLSHAAASASSATKRNWCGGQKYILHRGKNILKINLFVFVFLLLCTSIAGQNLKKLAFTGVTSAESSAKSLEHAVVERSLINRRNHRQLASSLFSSIQVKSRKLGTCTKTDYVCNSWDFGKTSFCQK